MQAPNLDDIDNELAKFIPKRSPSLRDRALSTTQTVRIEAPATTEIEHSAFTVLNLKGNERTLITFLEDDGYPILRITTVGESQDLILNNDQVKLLLRQMTLWLTR